MQQKFPVKPVGGFAGGVHANVLQPSHTAPPSLSCTSMLHNFYTGPQPTSLQKLACYERVEPEMPYILRTSYGTQWDSGLMYFKAW